MSIMRHGAESKHAHIHHTHAHTWNLGREKFCVTCEIIVERGSKVRVWFRCACTTFDLRSTRAVQSGYLDVYLLPRVSARRPGDASTRSGCRWRPLSRPRNCATASGAVTSARRRQGHAPRRQGHEGHRSPSRATATLRGS